jgi:hypothetical protein
MLNKVVTLEQVLSLNPCYSKEKILRLSRGKTEMTIGEIIDLRFVPAADKLWLLLREETIPARTLHEFAIWCAETALTRANVTDERSWNALKVKRLWLNGKATDKELAAASDSAYEAAKAFAGAPALVAAWDATTDVALASAWDTAWDTAWAAARDATRDAVWDAAWDAAWDEQLAKLKEMLGGTGQ